MKIEKENHNWDSEEWGAFEEVYISVLERGFTHEEIDILIKNIILKRNGGMSEEKALVLLHVELSGTDMEEEGEYEDEDEGEDECEDSDDSDYKKALELEDWVEIGDGFYEQGLYYEAIKYYERALDEDPELPQIWKRIGNCNLKIGDYDDANICFVIARRPVVDVKDFFEQMNTESEEISEIEENVDWILYKEGEFQEEEDFNEVIDDADVFLDKEQIPFKPFTGKNWIKQEEKNRLKRMYEEMELSIVEIPSEAWDYLVDGSNDRLWDFPVTLSCNSRKDVWFCVKNGRHREDERRYIDLEEFPFLQEIVDHILEINPRGGRFHLSQNRAYLRQNSKYKKICVIVVD